MKLERASGSVGATANFQSSLDFAWQEAKLGPSLAAALTTFISGLVRGEQLWMTQSHDRTFTQVTAAVQR